MDQPVIDLHNDLVTRCKVGDQDAHYQLYKLYSKGMYNVAFRIVRNEDEANDVLQEAFISAFRNLERFRAEATFGAWIKRIVVNEAINALKRKKFEPIPEDNRWDVAEEETPLEYADELTVDRVKRNIALLPDGYRSVLSLYLLEGYDHQEIGEIMGISESTSKSQLNRAKTKLRELLTARA